MERSGKEEQINMKIIESTCELIIIVLAFLLIVLPEIVYILMLRGRDWTEENYNLLKVNYKRTIKKGVK